MAHESQRPRFNTSTPFLASFIYLNEGTSLALNTVPSTAVLLAEPYPLHRVFDLRYRYWAKSSLVMIGGLYGMLLDIGFMLWSFCSSFYLSQMRFSSRWALLWLEAILAGSISPQRIWDRLLIYLPPIMSFTGSKWLLQSTVLLKSILFPSERTEFSSSSHILLTKVIDSNLSPT